MLAVGVGYPVNISQQSTDDATGDRWQKRNRTDPSRASSNYESVFSLFLSLPFPPPPWQLVEIVTPLATPKPFQDYFQVVCPQRAVTDAAEGPRRPKHSAKSNQIVLIDLCGRNTTTTKEHQTKRLARVGCHAQLFHRSFHSPLRSTTFIWHPSYLRARQEAPYCQRSEVSWDRTDCRHATTLNSPKPNIPLRNTTPLRRAWHRRVREVGVAVHRVLGQSDLPLQTTWPTGKQLYPSPPLCYSRTQDTHTSAEQARR